MRSHTDVEMDESSKCWLRESAFTGRRSKDAFDKRNLKSKLRDSDGSVVSAMVLVHHYEVYHTYTLHI